MNVPTAIVETRPELVNEAFTQNGLVQLRYYQMQISPHPEEPFKSFKQKELFEFVLAGAKADPSSLTPGTAIHVTNLSRSSQGLLHGYGLLTVQNGACTNCQAKAIVQTTPEFPATSLCPTCASIPVDPQAQIADLTTKDLG